MSNNDYLDNKSLELAISLELVKEERRYGVKGSKNLTIKQKFEKRKLNVSKKQGGDIAVHLGYPEFSNE